MAHAPPKLESLLELQFSRVRTGSLDVHAHPSSCIMSRSLLCCYCHYRHNGRPHISVKGCVHFPVGRSSFLRPNSSGKALNKHSQPTTNSLAGPEGRPVLHSPLNTDAHPPSPVCFLPAAPEGWERTVSRDKSRAGLPMAQPEARFPGYEWLPLLCATSLLRRNHVFHLPLLRYHNFQSHVDFSFKKFKMH